MVTKSLLKLAIAAEKGIDFGKLRDKKKQKASAKRKKARSSTPPRSDGSDWEDETAGEPAFLHNATSEAVNLEESMIDDAINLAVLQESDDSESSVDMEQRISRPPKIRAPRSRGDEQKSAHLEKNGHHDEDEEEEEDEEDIPMSDLEDLDEEEREDLIAHTRLTINNTTALLASLKRVNLPKDSSVPFSTHMCVVSSIPTAEAIADVSDDLQRETALLGQSLEAARKGRALLKTEGVPFSRPNDYFAEMVKPDAHMEKVKAKLVEEATARKASAEARKLREMKKFGKQVQMAKLQERAKTKKETLEKIQTLKRKRQNTSGELGTMEADLFDVAVDNEIRNYKKPKTAAAKERDDFNAPNKKRQYKNEKFGFGGKKRFSKSGDAISSGDVSSVNSRKTGRGKVSKTKALRPGKRRRKAESSRV